MKAMFKILISYMASRGWASRWTTLGRWLALLSKPWLPLQAAFPKAKLTPSGHLLTWAVFDSSHSCKTKFMENGWKFSPQFNSPVAHGSGICEKPWTLVLVFKASRSHTGVVRHTYLSNLISEFLEPSDKCKFFTYYKQYAYIFIIKY